MRTLLYLLPVFFWSASTLAQQPAAQQPSSAVLQSCLLGTGPEQWGKLKLSGDQVRRMKLIQEACQLECEGAGVVVVPNPIADSDGDLVMDEVRMVLSTEQYTNWVAYCGGIGRGQ